jgi:hypothetical protein
MTRSRDWRRAQKNRVVAKMTNVALNIWHDDKEHWWRPFEVAMKIMAESIPTCSKPWCCGNPRKIGKLSKQELKANQKYKYDLKERYE